MNKFIEVVTNFHNQLFEFQREFEEQVLPYKPTTEYKKKLVKRFIKKYNY